MIPAERCQVEAENALARIQRILTAQSVCPDPFRMTTAELAVCVQHHAGRALLYAQAAQSGGLNPEEVPEDLADGQ